MIKTIYPSIYAWIMCNVETNMDAMDWKAARWTATSPRRVGSEKLAASTGEGPRRRALYVS